MSQTTDQEGFSWLFHVVCCSFAKSLTGDRSVVAKWEGQILEKGGNHAGVASIVDHHGVANEKVVETSHL